MKNGGMEDDKGADNKEAGTGSKEGSENNPDPKKVNWILNIINNSVFQFVLFQAVILFTYLAFQDALNKIWGNCVVTPFLNWSNSTALLILTVLLCVLFLFKGISLYQAKEKSSLSKYPFLHYFPFISSVRLSILLSVFILLVYNRFINYWTFLPIFSSVRLTYYDVVLILLCLHLILCHVVQSYKQSFFISKKTQLDKEDCFAVSSDLPIDSDGSDLLERTDLIASIRKTLLNLDVSEFASVIGISGEWGSGKTSILNL
ncbi:MAG: P-loop NTPase fold protein, partial [Bacteroidaceae bacterium]